MGRAMGEVAGGKVVEVNGKVKRVAGVGVWRKAFTKEDRDQGWPSGAVEDSVPEKRLLFQLRDKMESPQV